jgi:pyruvate/2-oxoglutarate dehydrogenase complex dihydrolipoamide acyltransferase (E2) component
MVTLVNVPNYLALKKNYGSPPLLTKWMGKDGQAVEEGHPLVVVETSKATLEIESMASGLLFILRNVGDTVKIGDTLGMIANTKEEIEAFQMQLMNYLNGPPEQATGTSG